MWGTVGSLGVAAGVLFGGALTSALGWRAVFFINVPIGVAVIAGALRGVDRGSSQPRALRRLDLPGAATLVGGLLALVFGIEATRVAGWTARAPGSPGPGRGAAGRVRLAGGRVRRTAGAPGHLADPVAGLRLGGDGRGHRCRGRRDLPVLAVPAGGIGSSPLVAGLQFLPLAAAITLAATVASKLIGRVGPRTLIFGGLVIMASGVLLLAANAGGTSYAADVLPGFLLVGAGVGPMFVAIAVAAMSEVPAEKSGLASGLMMTGHEIGAALGVARSPPSPAT